MAVQARYLSHGQPHAFRLANDAPAFPDEFARCAPAPGMVDTTRLREFPRSDLTTCGDYGFEPRKRARVAPAGDGFLEGLQCFTAQQHGPLVVDDPPGGALASTSGRVADSAAAGSGLLSPLYFDQGAEIDALVRLESERMRAGLEDARRCHARELLAAAGRAASRRLRAAEAELERALRRNAELEDRARQAAAECQAWAGVARSHEAVAAGLRATLDNLLIQLPCAAAAPVGTEGDAEDAQSCCFEAPDTDDSAASKCRAASPASCRACGGGEACVLLLPCRHLCLCRACDAAVDACPVCFTAKNASLQVLLS